jgi:hypothetical protein
MATRKSKGEIPVKRSPATTVQGRSPVTTGKIRPEQRMTSTPEAMLGITTRLLIEAAGADKTKLFFYVISEVVGVIGFEESQALFEKVIEDYTSKKK